MRTVVQENSNAENHITMFFDEMNILKSEKQARIKTAMVILKKMNGFYIDLYNDILNGIYLHGISEQDYIERLVDIYLQAAEYTDKSIVYDEAIINKAQRFATYITSTNRKDLTFENDPELQGMIMMGVPIPEKRLPRYIKDEFSEDSWRAVNAATNESIYLNNYVRHKKKAEQHQLTHTWETMKDEYVRPTHVSADGQTVPINEPFIVGGYKLMFPGDDSMGASPNETVNCRCWEL